MYVQGGFVSLVLSFLLATPLTASSSKVACPITMTPLVGIFTGSKHTDISELQKNNKVSDTTSEQFQKITIVDLARVDNTTIEKEITSGSSAEELMTRAGNIVSLLKKDEMFINSRFYKDWAFLVSFEDFEFLSQKNASELVSGDIAELQDLCLDILSLHFGVLPSRVLQRSGLSNAQARVADERTWKTIMHALITESLQWRAHVRKMSPKNFIHSHTSGYDEDPELNTFTVSDMSLLHDQLRLSAAVEPVMDCNKNKICKAERVVLGLVFLLVIVLCVIIRIGWLKIRRRKQKSMSY